MNLADALRAAIRESHDRIENTPLAQAMVRGTVSQETYSDWLTQMGYLHRGLEAALAGCPDATPVYTPADMNRSRLIEQDLAALGSGDSFPCTAVLDLVDEITEWREHASWKLLGALYVIEGSRMGSMALVRPLARALGIRPGQDGLSYHLDGIETRPQKWAQFRAALSALPLDDERHQDIRAAAIRVMCGLNDLFTQFGVDEGAVSEPAGVPDRGGGRSSTTGMHGTVRRRPSGSRPGCVSSLKDSTSGCGTDRLGETSG